MKTNIDRLHEVVLNKLSPRGAGQTTADCHTVAGIIELGETELILCVIPSYSELPDVVPKLRKVLFEHELLMRKLTSNVFKCMKTTIRFISKATLKQRPEKLEGMITTIVNFT